MHGHSFPAFIRVYHLLIAFSLLLALFPVSVRATGGVAHTNLALLQPRVAGLGTARLNHSATLLPNGKVLIAGGGGGGVVLASAELYDPATGTLSSISSMHTPRWYHTATLLPSGRVLVAGGNQSTEPQNSGGALDTAELYDPTTDTWTDIPNRMTAARAVHTATLLPNGEVLLVGGGNASGPLASAELYDPATETWRATSASMRDPRWFHTTTLLQDGRVLVAGGKRAGAVYLNTAEVYDPALDNWSVTANTLSAPRDRHTATLLPNGRVLVVGGFNGAFISTADLYDPTTNTWRVTATPMSTSRREQTATLLPDGHVLVAGGFSGRDYPAALDVYDPATDRWTAADALTQPGRDRHTATLLPSGQVLLLGGGNGVELDIIEVYNPAVGRWNGTGPFAKSRYHPTVTLLPNGKVLAVGGRSGNTSVTNAELYDPVAGTWSDTSSMSTARDLHTATLLSSGKVLVVGGRNGESALASAELYDPLSDTWSDTGSLNFPRWFHTATLLSNGDILVTGGYSGTDTLKSSEVYNPESGRWTVAGDMITSRAEHTATLLPNGKVLVAGGQDSPGTSFNSSELYNPIDGSWHASGVLRIARDLHTATLLPNGKLLVAGGRSNGTYLSSAELYDPAAGTWNITSSMTSPRDAHTATLLPNGAVLIVGGNNGVSSLAAAELYDPALNTWRTSQNLAVARDFHAAALLPSGSVLVAGGRNSSGETSSVELFDPGLGFQTPWRPAIATITSLLAPGGGLTLSGSGFRGIAEASSGSIQSSPTNYPLLQLRSLANEQTRWIPPNPAIGWSNTSFVSVPVTHFPPGYALATVFANGIPSVSALLQVAASTDRYVAPSGSDTSDCLTPATACRTIGAALGTADDGNTIHIASGTYVEHLVVGKSISFVGAGAGTTIVDGGGNGRVMLIANEVAVRISDLSIQHGNTAGSVDVPGAGIMNNGALTLVKSVISNNAAAGSGGGIYNIGTLHVIETTISGNSATGDGNVPQPTAGAGGGIDNRRGTVTLTDSTISGNVSNYEGGGIGSDGALTIINSTISGNAAVNGGGIRNISFDTVLTATNTTISGNSASGSGGGIYNVGLPIANLNNVTITQNSADSDLDGVGSGGGIADVDGKFYLRNTIVAANLAPATSSDCSGTFISLGNNLLGIGASCNGLANGVNGDQVGSGARPIDPRLSPLRDNGGRTLTHALLSGSPAIDTGSPAAPGSAGNSCDTADQRGVIRPQGLRCDIGAYEAGIAGATDLPPHLVFTTAPVGGLAGQPLAIQPVVLAQDRYNNLISIKSPITLTLKPGTGTIGARLSGTLTMSPVGGVAMFTNLSIDRAGSDYKLIASADGLTSAESEFINILQPPTLPPADPDSEIELNDTLAQANPLIFDTSLHAARTGLISATANLTTDIDLYHFAAPSGAQVTISLTSLRDSPNNLPDNYDIVLLPDPSTPVSETDNIDLSNISDVARNFIARNFIARNFIARNFIARNFIARNFIGETVGAISDRKGHKDEAIQAYLTHAGRYFVMVYGASEKATNPNHRYRLDVTLHGDALALPGTLAHPITSLNAAPDPQVRTIYVYNSARMEALYQGPAEEQARNALNAALTSKNALMDEDLGNGKGKGASLDLGDPALVGNGIFSDELALYNQWDRDLETRTNPLYANEVGRQIWYVLDYALTNIYTRTTDIVLVGGDDVIPFFRAPDETTFANESRYYQQLQDTASLTTTALSGSLFHSFIQTDNFYADRKPTKWRGRELYLPDLGLGRLVERPSDIMHYLNGYLGSNQFIIDATQSSPLQKSNVFVTGYDFLRDEADRIAEQYKTYGLNSNVLNRDDWNLQQFTDAWFSGHLADLTRTPIYSGTQTAYYLTSLNSHFSHFGIEPAITDTNAFSAEILLDPTSGQDTAAYFKINGAPTLIYSVGCHSGLSASDSAFPISPTLQADFPQAVLKQGGNWIGNTGYGYGDSDLIGYSERLAVLFTGAIGRTVAVPEATRSNLGPSIGESLAHAKREYVLTSGPGSFSIYDEKVISEMTLYGLPFIRVRLPTPTPPPLPAPPPSVWVGRADANGIFTRVITLTNDFTPTLLDPISGDSVVRVTSHVSDSFRSGGSIPLIVSQDRMAQGQPVLPLLTYDITLQAAPGAPNLVPIPRGVRLRSALTADLDNFNPHVTTTVTDLVYPQQQNDPRLAPIGLWQPDLPYTYVRTAQNLAATDVVTADKLLVIAAQIKARNAELGTLRQFKQMVFEITYIDPSVAQPAALAQQAGPVFRRVQLSTSRKRGTIRLSATVDAGTSGEPAQVSATYTLDGANWQRVVLTSRGKGRYDTNVPASANSGISVFFEAIDKVGNVTVATASRNRRR